MVRDSNLLLVLLSTLALGSCNRHSDMEKLNKLATRICACTTLECATEALESIDTIVTPEAGKRLVRNHPEDINRFSKKLIQCFTDLPAPPDVSAEMPFLPTDLLPIFPGADRH